jgi:hypothetical protein
VHRKNRFFADRRSQRNTRAGGVSPPWEPAREATTENHGKSALVLRRHSSARLRYRCRRECNWRSWAHAPAVSRDFAEAPLQVRYPRPRRADARRSWLCVRSSLNNIRFSRHSDRMTEPRRADARRSCERAFVHRKNRFFADKRSRSNTRAGGVSPPWQPCTRGQRLKITKTGAGTSVGPLRHRSTRMRWRSWAHCRQSPATLRRRLCKRVSHTTAG